MESRVTAAATALGGLEVAGVTVRFGGVVALDGVSLEVRPHEVVGVIGPNGAGKTTLFNAICGFVRPASGSIVYAGRQLVGSPPRRLTRLGVARTLQGLGLWASLTVIENVLLGSRRKPNFGAALLGLPASDRFERELRRQAVALLVELGVEAFAEARPGSLPYGVQKRVSIARALMSEPSLLLLDEPASGLSGGEVEDLAALLAPLRDRMSLAVVEHNVDLVMAISDRVAVLNLGRVLATGTPDQVRGDPAVAEAYLGERVPGQAGSAGA
ncbi:MAG: ABC transporter ATP-binding protein [Candidatus Dormibacteraceae bacterium]